MNNHISFNNDKKADAFCAQLDAQGIDYQLSIHNCGGSTVHY